MPFLPQKTLRVLQNIRNHYPNAWSKYGFVNAFNPFKNWYDHDVIAIDTGITMIMAENLRTGFVWETFMKTPGSPQGHAASGIRKVLSVGADAFVRPASEAAFDPRQFQLRSKATALRAAAGRRRPGLHEQIRLNSTPEISCTPNFKCCFFIQKRHFKKGFSSVYSGNSCRRSWAATCPLGGTLCTAENLETKGLNRCLTGKPF